METKPLNENVDFSIDVSRNSIIDKFLLAGFAIGLPYFILVLWRDLSLGIVSINSIVNFFSTAIPTVLWFLRKRFGFRLKALVLFIVYFITSVKSVLIFGTYSNSAIIFLCFCCIIVAVSLDYKWSILTTLVLSLIIPLRGYLHLSGIYEVDVNVVQISAGNIASWLQLYMTFLLTSAMAIFGVGQLRLELNKYIALLQRSISELRLANDQLKNEVELKSFLQEDLQVSLKKFQGLFEGSRDGVVLLNNKGRIIEANPAAIEMSGFSEKELRDIDIFQLVDERFRKESIEKFENSIRGESPSGLDEVFFVTKAGRTVPVEVNSNLIISDDELMVLSTVRDISYRKQLENDKFNAALEAEERERERFSKDLHDDLGPVFSTLNLYLQTLGSKETDDAKRNILNNLSSIVDSAVKQVREISHNLSPYLLRDAGLVEAIRTHLKRFHDHGTIATHFEVQSEVKIKLRHNVEIVLYRVFLELLNNTIKHSGATHVKIHVSLSSKELLFIYSDNGKGFDPHKHSDEAGIGIKNIENRVRALEGTIDFRYFDDEMSIEVKIPL